MEVYDTEEEQVAAFKRWWKENGTSLLIGAAIGLSSIGGWRYYQSDQEIHRIEASDMYESIVNQIAIDNDEGDFPLLGESLATNYADTPYAAIASLAQAKHDYEHDKVDAAISKLSWVVHNANDIETQQIAQTRLIRVYLGESNLNEAEKLLKIPHPTAFDGIYEELNGDLFVAKNELVQARVSYDKAIALRGGETSLSLQVKRQNLGE